MTKVFTVYTRDTPVEEMELHFTGTQKMPGLEVSVRIACHYR